MTLSRLLGEFVLRHKRAYLISAFLLASIAVLTVLVPRKVGHLVDALAAQRISSTELMLELAQLLAIAVTIYLCRVGWRLQLFAVAYRLGQELRTRLYQRLMLHGPGFYNQHRTGDLMALATNDIDAIEMAAGEAMLAAFDGSLTLILVVAMMVLGVDWRLGLVALLPFPLMAWAFWYISEHIHEASTRALRAFGNLNDHVQQSLAGVRNVRALGLEQHCAGEFSQHAGEAAQASYDAQRWEAAYEPAVGITLAAAIAATLGLGSWLILQGELSIGQLTSFSMYLGQLIWPMFAAGWVLALIERARAALGRLWPVLSAPPDIADQGQLTVAPRGALQVQQLSYRYPQAAQTALHDISFTLQPGQTLGLVGPTGSGKSTLIRLLLRQYSPDSGRIVWGDAELAHYSLDTLRQASSWVPQESFLFSATLAENIALAKPQADIEEVRRVAQLAAIDEDIARFPHAYQTEVGERGLTLSGGQRQRVALARALLADSRLLLLDDALSAVDTGTETRILQHLQEMRAAQPDKMVAVASHRLSAVVNADHILVLREGHIIEQGTHQQLLELNGWYASQWRYQQLEASLEAS
ncbi:ABC transporter transmembrane domain-containing protein [Massilia sp. W12]|uniref:ABC transporter ATP-binding protein n=1 Tax=Massilia sp. W12 TaxID=3126507 RepID=UPI0030CFD7A0